MMSIPEGIVTGVESVLKKLDYPPVIGREAIVRELWDGGNSVTKRPSGKDALKLRWRVSATLPKFGYTRVTSVKSKNPVFRRIG